MSLTMTRSWNSTIEGYYVMVTGHRDAPPHVGSVLHQILQGLQARHPEGLVAVSGMAVGADALFNDAAITLGVPLIAAIPIPDHDARWPHHARVRYAEHLRLASERVNVWEDPRYQASSYGAMMHARNAFMLNLVQVRRGVVLAVWDGRLHGGTYAAVDGARRRKLPLILVDPRTGVLRLEKPPAPVPDVFDLFAEDS